MEKKSITLNKQLNSDQAKLELAYYDRNDIDSLIVIGNEYIDEVEFEITDLPRKQQINLKHKI